MSWADLAIWLSSSRKEAISVQSEAGTEHSTGESWTGEQVGQGGGGGNCGWTTEWAEMASFKMIWRAGLRGGRSGVAGEYGETEWLVNEIPIRCNARTQSAAARNLPKLRNLCKDFLKLFKPGASGVCSFRFVLSQGCCKAWSVLGRRSGFVCNN